jgi:hypothetical protein
MKRATKIDFASLMPAVAAALLGEENSNLSNPPKDVRYGTHGSMSVDLTAGTFFDHENNIGGGVIDLVQHKLNCDHGGAVSWLRSQGLLNGSAPATPTRPNRKAERSAPRDDANETRKIVVAEFPYEQADGGVAYVVERIQHHDGNDFVLGKDGKAAKSFRQRRPILLGAANGSGTSTVCRRCLIAFLNWSRRLAAITLLLSVRAKNVRTRCGASVFPRPPTVEARASGGPSLMNTSLVPTSSCYRTTTNPVTDISKTLVLH